MLFNEIAKKLTGIETDLIKDNMGQVVDTAAVGAAYTEAPQNF